jgi:toxoflavin biosynthesis protein ToxD
MAGNVQEYVAGHYAPYPDTIRTDDDLTTARQTHRITRGGSFTTFGDLARCRRRHRLHTQQQLNAIGFRLAESDN